MARGAEKPLYQVVTVDEKLSEEQGNQVRVLDLKMGEEGKKSSERKWMERKNGQSREGKRRVASQIGDTEVPEVLNL